MVSYVDEVKTKMGPSNIKFNPIGMVATIFVAVCLFVYWMGMFPGMAPSYSQNVNLRELLSVGIDVARKGGDRVRVIRDQNSMAEESKGDTKEGAKMLVTNGDFESHKLMYYGIRKAFPNIQVVSEEHDSGKVDTSGIPYPDKFLSEIQTIDSSLEVPASDITVWIDPLDATQEYTENLRQYVTVMMCVAVRGQPIIGVIYKPFLDKTYWGFVGQGHSHNLVTPESFGDKQQIIVSRSHSGQVAEVAKAISDNIEIIPAGGAGYKTLEVIAGNASAYVHVTAIKKWDLCAGNAIIKSVDFDHKDGVEGRMTSLEGRDIDYSAAGSPLHEDGLLATIHKHDDYQQALRPAFEDMKGHH